MEITCDRIYETAEDAWNRIATRQPNHPLEKIGRRVFAELSEKQWLEVLAAVCKNNISHPGRVPNLTEPLRGIVQDDAEVFAVSSIQAVPSGGELILKAIHGGFQCTWIPS